MIVVALALAVQVSFSSPAPAADAAMVQQAIGRGAGYLRAQVASMTGGEKSLAAVALLKAGLPPDAPEIKGAIDEIRKRIDPVRGYHFEDIHAYYVAGVDAYLLAEADPEHLQPELQALANFITKGQKPNGSWDYPTGGADGDTSCTHYAMLGLWACTRSGIQVPPNVWSNVLNWHLRTQMPDGGFAYKPGSTQGHGGGASMLNMTVNGLGSMAIAWMHLSDTPPSLDVEDPKPKATPFKPLVKNNSVLEAVPIEPPKEKTALEDKAGIPSGTAKAMKRAYGWLAPRYLTENKVVYGSYYYYSLERMSALVNISKIGSHDWFAECTDLICSKQNKDGSWEPAAPQTETALTVLALTRATAKLLKRSGPIATFGNGLLQGGRGLPDNLRDGDKPKPNSKPATPLDQLLSSLSKASNLEVEEMQDQLVEQVQIGDRQALIQQKDLLVKLIQHPSAEVRRTAAWALGRTNDLSLARYLVTALEDKDLDVNIEAHNGLCWISRKPAGFDLLLDPLEGLPLDAGPDVKEAAIKAWRSAALKVWGTWYLKNRPYKERGDEFEAKLREKLATLN